MGRIGESFTRLLQTAHKMKEVRGPLAGDSTMDDNQRVLRYLAKLTINPALTHGIAHEVGSLETGKLADIVLWPVGFFGVKPAMIVKGGAIAWSLMGEPNASIPTVEPVYYRPMFGAHPSVVAETCVTFVSAAAKAAGVGEGLSLRRRTEPVRACRSVSKTDLVRNDALPRIEVNPETYEVREWGGAPREPARSSRWRSGISDLMGATKRPTASSACRSSLRRGPPTPQSSLLAAEHLDRFDRPAFSRTFSGWLEVRGARACASRRG